MSASQTFSRSRPPLKKYRHCTVYMRSSITFAPQLHAAKAERVGGLGEEKRWRFSFPQLPGPQEISHTLKYDRPTVSPLHPNYTPQRPKERGAWGERSAGVTSRPTFRLPQLPRPQEIKHTLKYDRLKLPTTFFTDKYGQVQIQTDIYEQQVYRTDVRPDKLLFSWGKMF